MATDDTPIEAGFEFSSGDACFVALTIDFVAERHDRTVLWRPYWLGVAFKRRGEYRLGFSAYRGFSSISFADCADAMLGMLTDDTFLYKAPIVQY